MNELGLEDEFVSDRLGTTHRAIDVFRTGEFQGTHNERLRIIKLLEDSCTCAEECYCTFNKAYDLIKGKQK